MRRRPLPTTIVLALAACGGASDQEVHSAKTSGYQTDFAIVYSETLAAVRDLYPSLIEDARTGSIKTSWHPVNVEQGAEDTQIQPQSTAAGQRNTFQTTTSLRKIYFIRFNVAVVGGRPWRVRVEAYASAMRAGEIPTPLRGPEIPHWLEGRKSALEVAIYRRLKPHAVALKFQTSDGKPKAKETPLDLGKFGALPPAAAKAIATVERAATSRNAPALRAEMADEFTFSLGEEPSADTAIAIWQADPNVMAEIGKALAAGCAKDRKKGQVVCPAEYLSDPDFTGPRAGFARVGGAWRMVFFVDGE
jgi:hypothetical protein